MIIQIQQPDIRDKLIKKEASKAGLRGHINAKCIECIYDPCCEGSWRKQVEKCTSKTCPLYTVRPLTKNGVMMEASNELQH